MKRPRVSVVILNHNGEPYLENCIRSLLKQTYKDFEIILVDNGSTDRSVTVAEELKERYGVQGLRIISTGHNLGVNAGNNVGIRNSRGDYIAFLHVDTYVDSRWLEELMKTMGEGDDIAFVGSKILYPDGSINAVGLSFDKYGATKVIGLLESDRGQYLNADIFAHAATSFLARRDVLAEIGLFDEELFVNYDELDIAWPARILGYRVCLSPKSLCYHFSYKVGLAPKTASQGSLTSFFLGTLAPLNFYYKWRNRIRLQIRNYSLRNLIKRLPLAICLILSSGLYLSLVTNNAVYLIMIIRSILWNLRMLGNTLIKRSRIQSRRVIKDPVIDESFVGYPLELVDYPVLWRAFRNFIRR